MTFSLAALTQGEAVTRILASAIQAVDPGEAVRHYLYRDGEFLTVLDGTYHLADFKRFFIIGAGKASQPMAEAVESILGPYFTAGMVISKQKVSFLSEEPFHKVKVVLGDHPLPGLSSLESTRQLVQLVSGLHKDDLVINLLSGGASALMSLPMPGVSLEDIRGLTRQLLACGATINEINCLRKHLDQVKGGRLAERLYPAKLLTLVLSDVVGSPLEVIGSGPTTSDPSTFADAVAVLKKYRILESAPASIRTVLIKGEKGKFKETLKPGDERLSEVAHVVIGDNYLAGKAALRRAAVEGFHSLLLTTYLQGEAGQVGEWLASILKQTATSGDPLPRPCCLVLGGETTVVLKGGGKGGRNQQVALGAVESLRGLNGIVLVTLATDGEDGPTDAAGAVVTGETYSRARQTRLEPKAFLDNNDSYSFFDALGDLVKTGPTGTNVNDLALLFAL